MLSKGSCYCVANIAKYAQNILEYRGIGNEPNAMYLLCVMVDNVNTKFATGGSNFHQSSNAKYTWWSIFKPFKNRRYHNHGKYFLAGAQPRAEGNGGGEVPPMCAFATRVVVERGRSQHVPESQLFYDTCVVANNNNPKYYNGFKVSKRHQLTEEGFRFMAERFIIDSNTIRKCKRDTRNHPYEGDIVSTEVVKETINSSQEVHMPLWAHKSHRDLIKDARTLLSHNSSTEYRQGAASSLLIADGRFRYNNAQGKNFFQRDLDALPVKTMWYLKELNWGGVAADTAGSPQMHKFDVYVLETNQGNANMTSLLSQLYRHTIPGQPTHNAGLLALRTSQAKGVPTLFMLGAAANTVCDNVLIGLVNDPNLVPLLPDGYNLGGLQNSVQSFCHRLSGILQPKVQAVAALGAGPDGIPQGWNVSFGFSFSCTKTCTARVAVELPHLEATVEEIQTCMGRLQYGFIVTIPLEQHGTLVKVASCGDADNPDYEERVVYVKFGSAMVTPFTAYLAGGYAVGVKGDLCGRFYVMYSPTQKGKPRSRPTSRCSAFCSPQSADKALCNGERSKRAGGSCCEPQKISTGSSSVTSSTVVLTKMGT